MRLGLFQFRIAKVGLHFAAFGMRRSRGQLLFRFTGNVMVVIIYSQFVTIAYNYCYTAI